MRTFSLLRALSGQFPVTAKANKSSSVAPWPVQSSFDNSLTQQLSSLQCGENDQGYASCKWLTDATVTAVATQKTALESLANVSGLDRKVVGDYLDDNVTLLDSCNVIRDRIETVNEYVESLKIVLHYLDQFSMSNSDLMLERASKVLNTCEVMEKRCAELEKCGSSLRKLAHKSDYTEECDSNNTELNQVLNGSKAVAVLVCGVLGIAMSFKTKRGLPAASVSNSQSTSWSGLLQDLQKKVKEDIEKRKKTGSVVMVELRDVVNARKNMRDLIHMKRLEKIETRNIVEDLRRSCGELEELIKPLEGKVDELYSSLVSIRMVLLNLLSETE